MIANGYRQVVNKARDSSRHREKESEVSLRNLISAPTRHPRELATSISAAVSNGTQGRRHVSCVVFDVDLKNKQFEIFIAADSTG
ncbi:hypothetical protein AVEN_169385-1 [Araneus ventricosus]|uniref:Uncharacterized protein n=1 Tax=Araneus ventricosus TaxID=182803 RepID=A0A4Y2WZ51_ARAVE|nr:hypothetical protein AVEN_169385-1 [Araneus ventricosus]